MRLSKIRIDNFKSIKSPVEVYFNESLPTVLIGKNGSGKTNLLEALAVIASANSCRREYFEKDSPDYRAYIQLSEGDVSNMLPDVQYDRDKCEVVAYSTEENLKINMVKSEYLVPSLRKEIADIRDLAVKLKKAVDLYEKQVIKISHDGDEELPIGCYQLIDANGRTTNYDILNRGVRFFIDDVNRRLDNLQNVINDDVVVALKFIAYQDFYLGLNFINPFKLKYVEPKLAKFEEKFISINKTAIKREVTKINKLTKECCDHINDLVKQIVDRTERIQEGMDTDIYIHDKRKEMYFLFLRRVQHITGKRCLYLKNENNNVIFRKDDRNYYTDNSGVIMETYLRHVYVGEDKEELISSYKKDGKLSDEAVAVFEAFLNNNIPSFDKGMYDSISIKSYDKGHFDIILNESHGKQVSLNETSAGRRWYFTYYFMKNVLSEGDIFIIDEPAAMLHPSAQREVLADLMEMSKNGIKVVYTTHSPYLIPEEYQCVQVVTMTDDGTKVSSISSNQELFSQIAEMVGKDIFDIQTVCDMYVSGIRKSPEKIGKNCYNAIIRITKDLAEVASKTYISEHAIKSWNRNGDHFRCPSFENIVMVSKYTNVKIKDLLN